MIKLSQNENPFGASPLALKAMVDNCNSVHRYPDNGHEDLKSKLAGKFFVSPANIVVGAGSVALVDLAIKAFADVDENIVTTHKTFVAYRILAGVNRRSCKCAELENNAVNLDNVLSLCDSNTKAIFIANPNNPTGTIISHSALRAFLADLPPHIHVIMDEAYAEYVDDDSYPDCFELQKTFANLIIFRTFSKVYGLAGLRIGFAVAHPDIIRLMEKHRTQFAVNRPAATAASAAIDDSGFVNECVTVNRRERAVLYRELKSMGLNAVPSQGNFVLWECGDSQERERVFGKLKADGILVRELGPFGIENGLRISVGRPEENLRFLDSLKATGL